LAELSSLSSDSGFCVEWLGEAGLLAVKISWRSEGLFIRVVLLQLFSDRSESPTFGVLPLLICLVGHMQAQQLILQL